MTLCPLSSHKGKSKCLVWSVMLQILSLVDNQVQGFGNDRSLMWRLLFGTIVLYPTPCSWSRPCTIPSVPLAGIAAAGDDNNHGSAVTLDVLVLQALSKRIHYGKFVAEAKFRCGAGLHCSRARSEDAVVCRKFWALCQLCMGGYQILFAPSDSKSYDREPCHQSALAYSRGSGVKGQAVAGMKP